MIFIPFHNKTLFHYLRNHRESQVDSPENSASLHDPIIFTAEISENLESALDQIRDTLTDLDKRLGYGQAAQAAQRLPFQEYCFPAG